MLYLLYNIDHQSYVLSNLAEERRRSAAPYGTICAVCCVVLLLLLLLLLLIPAYHLIRYLQSDSAEYPEHLIGGPLTNGSVEDGGEPLTVTELDIGSDQRKAGEWDQKERGEDG